MKRRDFITKAGLVGAGTVAASALATPAIAADRVEIAMVATWGRDFPGLGTGAQRFAQKLSDVSDGRIQVTYYAAGERVGFRYYYHRDHSWQLIRICLLWTGGCPSCSSLVAMAPPS